MDTDGDGAVNLSDAVGIFGFLFGGGRPRVLRNTCVTVPGCSDACPQ